jgi:hypothetical protein
MFGLLAFPIPQLWFCGNNLTKEWDCLCLRYLSWALYSSPKLQSHGKSALRFPPIARKLKIFPQFQLVHTEKANLTMRLTAKTIFSLLRRVRYRVGEKGKLIFWFPMQTGRYMMLRCEHCICWNYDLYGKPMVLGENVGSLSDKWFDWLIDCCHPFRMFFLSCQRCAAKLGSKRLRSSY